MTRTGGATRKNFKNQVQEVGKQIDNILSSSLSMEDKDVKIEEIIEGIYGLSREEITFLHNL